MNITQVWMEFILKVIAELPTFAYAQERKFVQGAHLVIPGDVWNNGYTHTLDQLGYAGGSGAKHKQLMRNYFNEDEVVKAQKIIAGRGDKPTSSVGVSTIGKEKKEGSQGHCIRSIVVNHVSKSASPDKKARITVDVEYRTTELLRKFGADLIFLHDTLIPEIIKDNPWGIEKVDEVRMYFPTCFFSALFIPVLYYYTDPVEFLELARINCDPTFFNRLLFRTKTMLERDASHYKFRSRRNMQELAMGFLEDGVIDKEALTKYLATAEKETRKK